VTPIRTVPFLAIVGVTLLNGSALGQVSSLGAQHRAEHAHVVAPRPVREVPVHPRNEVYEQFSWITLKPAPPKTFKVGDILTVIVRQQRKFEADADLETKKKWDVRSELQAFLKPTSGGLGAATFHRGKPTIDYSFDNKLKTEGDANREDRFTTRLSVGILDVKPNGLLILSGRARLQHDDETSTITLTGGCRKEDVSADNTVLSTQISDLEIVVVNEGALRAASSRGWIPKLLDLLRPI